MHRVGTTPEIIRRQRQHTQDAPHPIVDGPMPEEGAVTAIVLDHKEANQ